MRMADKGIEKEFMDLEKQYWQAMKDKDVAAALRLTDDSCIIAGSQGVNQVDKKTMEAMLGAAPYTMHAFEIKGGAHVTLLRDDVAIIAYEVHEELTIEGKPVKVDAADASVWIRRDGRWVCALHTESLLGDPFGRDRGAK
jgi:hypothetical protein